MLSNCPTCGEGVAMRGAVAAPYGQSGVPDAVLCPHPCHAKAQAVVEAAMDGAGSWEKLQAATDALLASLESKETNLCPACGRTHRMGLEGPECKEAESAE